MIATYRNYQLPWELELEQDELFRRLLRQFGYALLALCIVVPLLPVPERNPAVAEELPPRFARLVLEKPVPPPPMVQPEPVRVSPQATVIEPVRPTAITPQPAVRARESAAKAGLLPFAEQLADLRNSAVVSNVRANSPLNQAAGEATRVERAVIAAQAGRSSGGISTASMSRNTGGGGLEGRETTRVSSPVAGMGADAPAVVRGGNAPSRSREEIELVFDRNKGAIFALYNRALRSNPVLQGKLVLQLTIAPSGEVTGCEVLSSELNDPEMEQRLVQRVKMFRFEAKDVATVTTTKPIDFFPA